MPIYVYKCRKCGHMSEARQSIYEPSLVFCEEPQCGGELHRVPQPTGVAYKGSGFHSTDYNKTGRNTTKYSDYTK